jgi:hypothetical protein
MTSRDLSWPPAALRWGELSQMAKSPANFRAAYLEPDEPSPGMLFGSVVHALVLGGDEIVVYDGERRGNAWKDFKAAYPGATIVTAKEHARAMRVANAVRADRNAAPLLEGLLEHELAWSAFGRACAGRPDVLGDGFVTEVKTTSNAEPSWFARAAIKMNYHAQLAHYAMGARANGMDVREAWIVAVETSSPFNVTILHVSPADLLEGEAILRSWVDRIEACERSGVWPGYAQGPVELAAYRRPELELIIDGEIVAA